MRWASSRRESPGPDAPGTVELAFRPVRAAGFYYPSYPLIAVPGVDLLRSRQELELFQETSTVRFFPEGEPKLDWSRESLLVARLGMRPSGGYAVDVDRVTLHGSTLTVDLFEERPGAGDVAMAFDYPVTAAVIPVVPAGTTVRWRHTDFPDCGLPGYQPQPLSGAEAVIDAHGHVLRELVGRRLERIWAPWDLDGDGWCYDYPVILDIGGTRVEYQRNNANESCLTFNSIDPSAVISPPAGSRYRNVVWRPPPAAELSALHGRTVTEVVVVEWYQLEDENAGRTALGLRFGEDWITVQNDYARFGLSREEPPVWLRRHAL
ncbi:protease complex subunit PrcB family protein [Kitasatospora sp. MAA4]|uniref:protease complex subunit PrcB family protein n=1 Tax=Kitasatospora sp. MAA4 TaxID=3035093 RepID=UPI002474DC4A|nr:protease complex subunit PrcB family protein [Kitasatospora sp. MAA4]